MEACMPACACLEMLRKRFGFVCCQIVCPHIVLTRGRVIMPPIVVGRARLGGGDVKVAWQRRITARIFEPRDQHSHGCTPLQNHQPRPFPTHLPRRIESKHGRDGVESRCARYAGAACWRGSTADSEQEVKKGRTDQENTYVLQARAQYVGAQRVAADKLVQRVLRVKSRRYMVSDHHQSPSTRRARRTAQRGRAQGLRRNGNGLVPEYEFHD